MSYIYNREIQLADTAQKDAFGRLRTSGITSLLELKHTFDTQPLLEDEIIDGGASVSLDGSTVLMETSGSDYIIRQSFASAPYQPGKSQIFEASFANLEITGGKNVIKRVGAYTSRVIAPYNTFFDGFFLESIGESGVINFCIYKDGTPVVVAPTTNWLTDDYDPTLIDWSKSQLMMVDYQWLGVGRVRFYMVLEGVPRLFYEYTHANNEMGVYMIRPNKPIRHEIRATGVPLVTDTLVEICSQISTEGSLNDLSKDVPLLNESTGTLGKNQFWGVLGFRGKRQGIKAFMKNFSIVQVSGANYILRVLRNPNFSVAPTWTTVTNTLIEYSTDVQRVNSGRGEIELLTYIANSSFTGSGPLDMGDSAYTAGFDLDGNSVEFWLCIEPISTNGTFIVGMNVEQYD